MMTTRSLRLSVVKSFGPTVFMNFGPGRKRLQIASGASGVAESCGLGQAVAGAAETVRGTLRVAGNGAGDSRAQRLGSGEHAAGGLAFGVDRTWASPWRLWQGPLEPLRGNVVGSFLDTLTVLPPRGGTGRTVTPSGALRVDGDTLWGVSVSRSGYFHMSVIMATVVLSERVTNHTTRSSKSAVNRAPGRANGTFWVTTPWVGHRSLRRILSRQTRPPRSRCLQDESTSRRAYRSDVVNEHAGQANNRARNATSITTWPVPSTSPRSTPVTRTPGRSKTRLSKVLARMGGSRIGDCRRLRTYGPPMRPTHPTRPQNPRIPHRP